MEDIIHKVKVKTVQAGTGEGSYLNRNFPTFLNQGCSWKSFTTPKLAESRQHTKKYFSIKHGVKKTLVFHGIFRSSACCSIGHGWEKKTTYFPIVTCLFSDIIWDLYKCLLCSIYCLVTETLLGPNRAGKLHWEKKGCTQELATMLNIHTNESIGSLGVLFGFAFL